MHFSARILTVALSLSLLAVTAAPPADAQSLRDRMRERMQQRGGAGMGGGMGGGLRGGLRGGMRGGALPAGSERVEISVGGQTRAFLVHTPPDADPHPAVMLTLHGGGGSASGMASNNTMAAQSDRDGFLAVFPEALDGTWNDGRAAAKGKADDIAFLRAVVDWLVENADADRARVYATGISNGGAMTHNLACNAPDLVAGIAPVAANFSETLYAACKPVAAIPVVMFSGTEDPLMLYDGGRPNLNLPGRGRGGSGDGAGGENLVPAETTIRFWADTAGCGSATATDLPDSAEDGTTVTRLDYACGTVPVSFFRIEGGGHTWPGGRSMTGRMADFIGTTSQDIDASAEISRFFGL